MAQEEFENDRFNKREKSIILVRRIGNYIMGGLIIAGGFFIIIPNRYTAHFVEQYDPLMMKIFAGLCWIYGAFRAYRGYDINL